MEVQALNAWREAANILYEALLYEYQFILPRLNELWDYDETKNWTNPKVLYDAGLVPTHIMFRDTPLQEISLAWKPNKRDLDIVRVTLRDNSEQAARTIIQQFDNIATQTETYQSTEVVWRDNGETISGQFVDFPGFERQHPQPKKGNVAWRWESPLPSNLPAGQYRAEWVSGEAVDGNLRITISFKECG